MDKPTYAQLVRTPAKRIEKKSKFLRDLEKKQAIAERQRQLEAANVRQLEHYRKNRP